jgi:uroporphyrinogen-III decarboxylase
MTTFKNDYSFFQKGFSRLKAAMEGIPDRVPVYAQMHEFVMKEVGANAREFYATPHVLPGASLEIMERYGIDVPIIDYDVYNIEAEAIGQAVVYRDHDMPDVDRTKPLIRDRGDLKKIKTPDFESDGRFACIIEMQSEFARLTGAAPVLGFCAPFSLAANIRGIEQLIFDIYGDPDFTRELFERITEALLAPWIQYQKEKFPESTSVCGSDATGSIPIVNPFIIREWIVPYILHLRELCGPEVYVPNWVGEQYLKDPGELFDLKLQVCPGYLQGQDPDVEALGPERYKESAEKRGVPLVLGIGAGFLALSNPPEVTKRVRHYIEVGGENGRFALYLCNIGATTPPENVRAAIEAVHTYGTYSG